MPVQTFSAAKGHQDSNIRKALEMAIFVKPKVDGDTEVNKIWTATGGLIVPAGYVSVGLMTKADGASWSRDQSSSDVESIGYGEPTRRDITKDVVGLAFTMQESKRQAMELFHGLDLSAVTTDTDGNFFFDKASLPVSRHYRVLAIGKDGDGPNAKYMARWLPNAQITEMGEQAWQDEAELNYPATFTAYTDDVFGTSMREIWGGPGVDHVKMGFPAKV